MKQSTEVKYQNPRGERIAALTHSRSLLEQFSQVRSVFTACAVHAALLSLFLWAAKTRPEPLSNRARGGFVAAWTGRRSRREQSDWDETIQFDGRRAALGV